MDPKVSLLIDQLTTAKALAEKVARRPMLVYLLDLAIVDAEEERERKHSSDMLENNNPD
ncbi:hypothetical protein ACVIRO_007615 [Rhizobium ruizarguesonis]